MRLVIIGAGGHGQVAADGAIAAGFGVLGLLDDDRVLFGRQFLGVNVLGPIEAASLSSKRDACLSGTRGWSDQLARCLERAV